MGAKSDLDNSRVKLSAVACGRVLTLSRVTQDWRSEEIYEAAGPACRRISGETVLRFLFASLLYAKKVS